MLADGSLTTPDLAFDDFGKAGLSFCTAADGKQNAVPTFVDYWILYYNKELFDQKGVAYPTSMDDVFTAAQKLTDVSKGVYGFVSRGLKNANVPVWTSWMLGQGVETGTVGFNWNECQTSFATGRAAMWLDGIGFATPLEDPAKSKVVGKVGYGVVPKGPKAQHSAIFGDGLGVSRTSSKNGAAWYYIQYITNK